MFHAGHDAVRGLKKLEEAGNTPNLNQLRPLRGIYWPEYAQKVAQLMIRQPNLKPNQLAGQIKELKKEQWIWAHLNHPQHPKLSQLSTQGYPFPPFVREPSTKPARPRCFRTCVGRKQVKSGPQNAPPKWVKMGGNMVHYPSQIVSKPVFLGCPPQK